MRKLLTYLRPYRHWAFLAPMLMLVETAADLLQPRMVQRIVDVGIAQQDMSVVLETGLWMVGISILGAIGGIGCSATSVLASQGFGADLRDGLFAKVQSLSFGNIDRFETGQLITRLTNDVTQVEELVGLMLRLMLRAPLLVVGSFVMAVVSSPQLSPLFAVLVPLIVVILSWVINKAYPLYGDVQERIDGLNTVMQENLAGVRVVKAFVRGDHEITRFRRVNRALMMITVRVARTVAAAGPLMTVTLYAGVVAGIWMGGVRVVDGRMQVGQVIAFVSYLTRTLWSLSFVSTLSTRIARAQASAERIAEVLDSVPEVQSPTIPQAPDVSEGRVAFEGVTFRYGDDSDPVLSDVSFVAEPGQTVALLGATGAGKSTLVHLIPRFYDVTDGAVTLDGVNVRDFDEAWLRRSVSIALQESVLFSGSIRDNIRYGRPEATDEEVVAAARAAQAHAFIVGFPEGYDTVIGQRGVNLSGGQKQRIAIARALLVKPAVLILDDSTSSVDVETESEIQAALDALMEAICGMRGDPVPDEICLRTTFVIAQRISTVLNADRILVLDGGRIAAEGTHSELMAGSQIYREIYASQLGDGGGNGNA
ncbi:MAG: ABC transporter ATP-binding protein/permease [Anaerolineae bacterium]|nr:ABC transporter ATP-binding protein/permease [Anaerolineae bacterium]